MNVRDRIKEYRGRVRCVVGPSFFLVEMHPV